MGVVLVDEAGEPIETRTYPSNLAAESLFQQCATQWQRNPMTNALLGLNYAGVEAAARLSGTQLTPSLFSDLQLIERGALGGGLVLPDVDQLGITRVELNDDG